jgi:phenylacetate-CoA ligase
MYTLTDLVEKARTHSPFYRKLYRDVPVAGWQLEDLPLIDLDAYREADNFDDNQILTEPLTNALVIRTGGTSGKTKLAFYANSELTDICRFLSTKNEGNGMQAGDRVATLLPAGNLYASYLMSALALHYASTPMVVFHFGFDTPFDELVASLQEFKIDVLIAFPTLYLKLAHYIRDNAPQGGRHIRKLYYFGETMFHDAREEVLKAFPAATIRSSGYSSVDGALIGYVDIGCQFNEHRAPDGLTIVELVDEESGEVIRTTGKAGKIYITSLARGLMPVIRYPSGDMARWVEPEGSPDRKFLLLGRAGEGVRFFGPIFYYNDVGNLLFPLNESYGLLNFQMISERLDSKDKLTLRIALRHLDVDLPALEEAIRQLMDDRYEYLGANVAEGIMWPLAIEFVTLDALEVSPVTGKSLRVIERRFKDI